MQTEPEPTPAVYDQHGEDSPGKKSVVKKVKDKAKKLKTKIKKPKSPGAADAGDDSDSSSSSEEESGSEPQQQGGGDGGQESGMVVNPGLQDESYEKIPDPHATGHTEGSAGVEKQFGKMGLDDKPDAAKLQGESPFAGEDSTSLKTDSEKPDPIIASRPQSLTERAVGLKDTIAAKLGYGSSKNLPVEEGSGATPDPENKSVLDKVKDSAAGAKETVASKIPSGAGHEAGDGTDKTYTQKAYDTAFAAKDAVATKLGYGSTDPTAPATEGEQKSYLQGAREAVASKLGYDNTEGSAPTEGARFHPGEEDRALSQLITEKMSTGATTVKDTLMRPFGTPKSGPSTPVTTPPPASAAAVAEDPAHNTVPEAGVAPEDKQAGIVGKMTGAVTSLLGTSGSGKKREEESAGKASEDSQPPEVSSVETH